VARARRDPTHRGPGRAVRAGRRPRGLRQHARRRLGRHHADAVDEYFKAFADADRRRGQLELYRSGDFEKLAPYEGKLAELGVATLLLWGADDFAAPVAGAHRFAEEIPGAEVVVLEGTGHFVVDDAPARYAEELVRFLRRTSPGTAR
jgi:pimeloyl-ACP methyl ester carboxylesterase